MAATGITIADGVGSNVGTITMLNNSEIILEKKRTETLQVDSGTDILVAPVAYKN